MVITSISRLRRLSMVLSNMWDFKATCWVPTPSSVIPYHSLPALSSGPSSFRGALATSNSWLTLVRRPLRCGIYSRGVWYVVPSQRGIVLCSSLIERFNYQTLGNILHSVLNVTPRCENLKSNWLKTQKASSDGYPRRSQPSPQMCSLA